VKGGGNMAQIDTKHSEKRTLMALLMAKHTGDIDTQIALTRAAMDKEDISDVIAEFEKWKSEYTANKKQTTPPQ
jgi:hypothetical protein